MALELSKSRPDTPDDRIRVINKSTMVELVGEDAPLRKNLMAFLEGHQTYYVPISEDLLRAREERQTVTPQFDPVRASTRMMLKDHLVNR